VTRGRIRILELGRERRGNINKTRRYDSKKGGIAGRLLKTLNTGCKGDDCGPEKLLELPNNGCPKALKEKKTGDRCGIIGGGGGGGGGGGRPRTFEEEKGHEQSSGSGKPELAKVFAQVTTRRRRQGPS